MGGSADEFPLLSALGLYAADIRGDGNCLFNALSDQLYGTQTEHQAIRARVIAYMRQHAAYYKQFIDVHPGGGIRRNPKRKNAGAYSSPVNLTAPTDEEIDRVFEGHLQSMARGGTYGDNMEISAFSSAYEVDVKIYQRDFAYMVSGAGEESQRDVAHIAYHMWEHYSSIRNLDGPHSGPPLVKARALSPEEEQRQKEKLAQTPHVLPWMIDVVSTSLPFLADKITVKKALEECKGSVNDAVSKLLDAEERGSVSSAQESSSVEREPDSDDDSYNGPNKKQNRRLSRATRSARKVKKPDGHSLGSKLADHSESQESLASVDSEASNTFDKPLPPLQNTTAAGGEEWRSSSAKKEDSTSASTSESARKGPIRLKLNPPRPPSESSSHASGKTLQKQRGPTSREKKDMQKKAQKAARKQRQQAVSKGPAGNGTTSANGPPVLSRGRDSPAIESGFRTLYI
ncbi:hypothetical protein B0A49_09406 [Cryomyces minteri]|uniref:OTU domain-containing protein n=1 Tax=Cryomyces minteri TaxID=331657 RepID=A0A4U0WET6_9PEZI|nr:hypothetical protein B0A49_09406 [Cryomyces minteri]